MNDMPFITIPKFENPDEIWMHKELDASNNVKLFASYKGLVRHGTYIERHENGKDKIRANYADGELDGEYWEFDKNGVAVISQNYKNGKRDGRSLRVEKNLNIDENFKDGLRDGSCDEYDLDGNIKTRGYYAQGKREGVRTIYGANRKVISTEKYEDGERCGTWETYDEEGNLEATKEYKNDKLEGLSCTYFSDGTKKSERNYKEDKLEGDSYDYYPNGKIKKVHSFKADLSVKTICYKQDGETVLGEYHYNEKGQNIGLWESWDNEGRMTFSENYNENGQFDGEYVRYAYTEDGTRVELEKGVYKDDQKSGLWVSRGKDGKLNRVSIYNENHSAKNESYRAFQFVQNEEGCTVLSKKIDWKNGKFIGPQEEYYTEGAAAGRLKSLDVYSETGSKGCWVQFKENGEIISLGDNRDYRKGNKMEFMLDGIKAADALRSCLWPKRFRRSDAQIHEDQWKLMQKKYDIKTIDPKIKSPVLS